LTGITEPYVCALTAYDAVWIAGLSLVVNDEPTALRSTVLQTADHYFGASGWTQLNRAGDREAADYDFWSVGDMAGQPTWQRGPHYQSATGQLERVAR
jgi:branched-chain amino acid transport system substrate-binding protein